MKVIFISLCYCLLTSLNAKVASTSPAITETLLALGLKHKLAAVSDFCDGSLSYIRVGTSLKPNFEKLVKSGAKIVFIQKNNDKKIVDKRYEKLGMKTYFYSFNTLAEIKNSVSKIASLFKVDDKKILNKFKQLEDKLIKIEVKKDVLMIVGVQKKLGKIVGVYAVGRKNHYNDLAGLVQANNIVTFNGYKFLNSEELLKLNFQELWYFSGSNTSWVDTKSNLFKNKKIIVWSTLSSQKVGVKVLDFMKEFANKLSP